MGRADERRGGAGRAQLGSFPIPFHLPGEDDLTLRGLDQAKALVSHQVAVRWAPWPVQALCVPISHDTKEDI